MTEAEAVKLEKSHRRFVWWPAMAVAAAVVTVLALAAVAFVLLDRGDSESGSLAGAEAAYESGDYPAAEESLKAVLAEDADDLAARKALALALAAQGKNEDALEQYEAIVEADPDDHASFARMAALEQLTGKASEAIEHLESAISVEPEPSYYEALAPIYVTVGKWAESVDAWQMYLDVAELDEKGQAQVHAAIASAYEGAREYDKARASLEQALFLDPNNETYKVRLEGYVD